MLVSANVVIVLGLVLLCGCCLTPVCQLQGVTRQPVILTFVQWVVLQSQELLCDQCCGGAVTTLSGCDCKGAVVQFACRMP